MLRITRSNLISLLLILTFSFGSLFITHADRMQQPAAGADLRPLETGKPIERGFNGGETHSYQIDLAAGQFARIVVDQRGIDVLVKFFDPEGKLLTTTDSFYRDRGPEVVFIIAPQKGRYRLDINQAKPNDKSGLYEVKLAEARLSVPSDNILINAQRAFTQGIQLREQLAQQPTPELLARVLDQFNQAVEGYKNSEERERLAIAITALYLVYFENGDIEKPIKLTADAYQLWQALGDQYGQAYALNDIATITFITGDAPKAIETFQQAIKLREQIKDTVGEARSLTTLGQIYGLIGEKQMAIDAFNQAQQLYVIRDPYDERRRTLNNIGQIYQELGDYQQSLDFLNQSLILSQALKIRQEESLMLTNIGILKSLLGDKAASLKNYESALAISREINDLNGQISILLNEAVLLGEQRENQAALEKLQQVQAIFEKTGDAGVDLKSLKAHLVETFGSVYYQLKDYSQSAKYQQEALALYRSLGNRLAESESIHKIALIEREQGNLPAAKTQVEAAIKIAESLRSKITSKALRSSYFATVQDFYHTYITILMELHRANPGEGYDASALQVSERARARSLLELLAEAQVNIREGIDAKLLESERNLQQQINGAADEQLRILSGPHTDEQQATIAKQLDALNLEYDNLQAKIRETSPRYAALTQPEPLSAKDLQTQVLDRDTILLEYSLGSPNSPDHSYLWLVTKDSIKTFELPTRAEIESAAREAYELITKPNKPGATAAGANKTSAKTGAKSANSANSATAGNDKEAIAALQKVSDMLLGPVAKELLNRRLLIVADGVLQFIPFAALPSPKSTSARRAAVSSLYRPLLADHEIVTLPSASTLAVLRGEIAGRKPAEQSVAVIADPVFERADERLQTIAIKADPKAGNNGNGNGDNARILVQEEAAKAASDVGVNGAGTIKELRIPRLPGTNEEARQILSLAPNGRSALGFEASRLLIANNELSKYRIIHFATHGFVNSARPELSGIVLSMFDKQGNPQDGFLRAHEVFNLKLPAELVVLSACETGLGKDIRGEGMVGLTRGFMYAGAARVVVSLWSVSDKATAALMTKFYQGMLGAQKLRPTAALRAAQLSIWQQPQWRSPYYWAAFNLQGEYK